MVVFSKPMWLWAYDAAASSVTGLGGLMDMAKPTPARALAKRVAHRGTLGKMAKP